MTDVNGPDRQRSLERHFDVGVLYGPVYGQGGARAGGIEARRMDRDQALGFAPVLAKGSQQRVWAYHEIAGEPGQVSLYRESVRPSHHRNSQAHLAALGTRAAESAED